VQRINISAENEQFKNVLQNLNIILTTRTFFPKTDFTILDTSHVTMNNDIKPLLHFILRLFRFIQANEYISKYCRLAM